MKIIYIAGYGRSGSTIFEKYLVSETNCFGVGEISNYFGLINKQSTYCSCGAPVINCQFWSKVRKLLGNSAVNCSRGRDCVLTQPDSITRAIKLRFKKKEQREVYQENICKLFSSINKVIPPNHIIIDSSKTAYGCINRPFNIYNKCKIEVKVIHMVRDVRAVYWSLLRGKNSTLELGIKRKIALPWIRAIVGWTIANYFASLLKTKLGEENYYLLKYEDFVSNPEKTIDKIKIHFKLEKDSENLDLSQRFHQISGNRSRFNKKISIKKDYEWKIMVGKKTKILTYYATYPLNRKFKYQI